MRKNAKLTNTAERKAFIAKAKGDEPVITPLNYNFDLAKFLNYHNVNTDLTTLGRWAAKYAKNTKKKEYIHAVKKAQDYELRKVGMLARAIEISYLEPHHIQRLYEILDDLVAKYPIPVEESTDTKEVTKVVNIQDRIKLLADTYGAEVDCALDDFLIKNESFSMKGFIAINNISPAVAKQIGELYHPLRKELKKVLAGKDEELTEGWSVFGRVKLKKYFALVNEVITECEQRKTVRKPRKRKEKPAGVLVSKMKYNKEQVVEGTQVVSTDPKLIIGAKSVYLYDTEKRKLTIYQAQAGETLSVKGTTILNFDVVKSQVKNVRKPLELIELRSKNRVMSAFLSYFKDLKAKPKKATGRTNDNQLILGVF